MRWYQAIEFALLAALMATIPLSFNASLWAMAALLAALAVKGIAMGCEKKHLQQTAEADGNLENSRARLKNAWPLLLPLLYWLCYAVSLLWTDNLSDGWRELEKLLPMPLMSIYFYTSRGLGLGNFLTTNRKRMLLWAMVLSIDILFVVRLIVVGCHVAADEKATWTANLFGDKFYYIHHSYMALYLLAGIAFLYTELLRLAKRQSSRPVGHLVLTLVSILVSVAFLVFVNSRAGILCLVLLIGCCLAHLFFYEKRRVVTLVATVLLAGGATGVYLLLPDSQHRLSATISEVSEGDTGDARFDINKKSVGEALSALPFGVGAGDRMDILSSHYKGKDGKTAHVFNPHNQYVDTLLATGIAGLVVLVLMLTLVAIAGFRQHDMMAIGFCLIMAVSLLFESILERQMGLVFFATFYCLLLLKTKNNSCLCKQTI